MKPRSLTRTSKQRWPTCRWLVLNLDGPELLEERIRIDWLEVWG